MFSTLEIEREGFVATIWMNRPERHNAFNATVIAELTQAFDDLGADAGVRVVVLAGRGKSFSAGADLNWMKAAGKADFEAYLADATRLAEMLRSLAEIPKPRVGRVQGAALAGGMGLVAACDICIASVHASFATSEVNFGIIPSAISPYVLRAIGPRQASRYFLTAERLDASGALHMGLVHGAVHEDQLDAAVRDTCAALLRGGPQALAAAKSLIRDVAGRAIDDALMHDTAQRIASLRMSAEARDGLGAFLEKRSPRRSA